MPFDVVSFISALSPIEIGGIALILLALFYVRRSGVVLWKLGTENRQLRQGIRGYERLEQDHLELSRENIEQNRFHGELPILIANLSAEKTLVGIGRQLIDFAARSLAASEVSLFLVEGGMLVLRESRGLPGGNLRMRVGEGRIGAVAQFRRIMASEDFQNLDPRTRTAIARSPVRIDTVIAAPLLAHGRSIGVLNVGGSLTSSPGLRREILRVVAQLGATALENQLNFDRLEREATTDGLTGLSNVRNFKEKMGQEISRAARFGRSFSVFLFDIDNFKNYNDRNGHPAGDECLRLTAELLRNNTRTTDLPARYGGEEFVVLLPETDRVGALRFAEKIRSTIAASDYPFREKQPLGCVSVSGGVATFPDDGKEIDTLIQAADKALYQCKQGGRNRVAAPVADAPLSATAP